MTADWMPVKLSTRMTQNLGIGGKVEENVDAGGMCSVTDMQKRDGG
jgi:hypothetical protein